MMISFKCHLFYTNAKAKAEKPVRIQQPTVFIPLGNLVASENVVISALNFNAKHSGVCVQPLFV